MTVRLYLLKVKRPGLLHLAQKILDRPTNAKATYLLLPYCAWLAYATYLNAGLWWLNRKDYNK